MKTVDVAIWEKWYICIFLLFLSIFSLKIISQIINFPTKMKAKYCTLMVLEILEFIYLYISYLLHLCCSFSKFVYCKLNICWIYFIWQNIFNHYIFTNSLKAWIDPLLAVSFLGRTVLFGLRLHFIFFLNLYWICYNASVLCFGFLAARHVGS